MGYLPRSIGKRTSGERGPIGYLNVHFYLVGKAAQPTLYDGRTILQTLNNTIVDGADSRIGNFPLHCTRIQIKHVTTHFCLYFDGISHFIVEQNRV